MGSEFMLAKAALKKLNKFIEEPLDESEYEPKPAVNAVAKPTLTVNVGAKPDSVIKVVAKPKPTPAVNVGKKVPSNGKDNTASKPIMIDPKYNIKETKENVKNVKPKAENKLPLKPEEAPKTADLNTEKVKKPEVISKDNKNLNN